jgi:photosystem II stability/assembly factor-like uncharacterized protein
MKAVGLPILLIIISLSARAQWTQTSGPVGAISNEILHVNNYLFVNAYNGGIYRSADKGLTWEPVNNGLPVDFRCEAMDAEGDKLYISTGRGIFFSDNLGNSWQAVTGDDRSGFSMEISGNEIFVGSVNNVSMHYSPDGGLTWEQRYSSVTEEGTRHFLKWGNTLWVGTDDQVYSSPDDGITWNSSTLHSVRPSSLNRVDADLFVSGNDEYGYFGVYRSQDHGTSWMRILSTQETNVPKSGFLKIGETIYITGFKALYYSEDNGISWTIKLLPHSFNFYHRTYLTNIGNDLFISYGDGILYTSDRGETWERRNLDFKNHTVIQLSMTNQSLATLTEFNGLYISKDNGQSWEWVPDHDDYRPRQVYAHDKTIFASYLLGIYKSEDEGQTWQKIFTLTDDIPGPHAIPDVHLAGWKETLIYCTYKGTFFSTDLGKTWDVWPDSDFETDAWIFKGFVHGDTVVLMTQEEFFFTTDFGKNWQKRSVPEGLTASYYTVTDMLFAESQITMSTLTGLYESPDLGTTWKHNNCLPDPSIFDMEEIDGTLIVSTLSGVYASRDRTDWYSVRTGLDEARTLAMVIKDGFSFVGTWGKSVWKRPVSDLLTLGEIIFNGEPVPKPLVEHTCSTISVANASPHYQLKWYKDGNLLPNETATKLDAVGKGVYRVSFENNCDLKVSDNVVMGNTPIEKPEVYNVITVNGDGKNDSYFLDKALFGSKLSVYNRWGEIVYSNQSYENSWSPGEISAGQYFYAIESECYGALKGVLTILKE